MTLSEQSSYKAIEVGGEDISSRKALFSYNGQFLLVPSAATIRVYISDTGDLSRVLKCSKQDHVDGLVGGLNIVNIQLHPDLLASQVIAFSSNGLVTIFDFTSGDVVRTFKLLPELICKLKNCLVFGRIFRYNHPEDMTLTYYVVYFGTGGKSPQLFYQKRDSLDKCEPATIKAVRKSKMKKVKVDTDIADTGTHKLDLFIVYQDKESRENKYNIAFPPNGHYIVVTFDNTMKALSLFPRMGETQVHTVLEKLLFTATACHPTDDTLATGNSIGMINIWSNFLTKNAVKSVLHWHSTPICDLWYTTSGSYLYSVASDSVLVRWVGNKDGEKNLLPRTGAVMRFVTCDRDNKLIATSHQDNSIRISKTDMSQKDHVLVEGLVKSDQSDQQLAWSSSLEAIISKGRTGHVQMYNATSGRQLCQMDITGLNYMADERNKIMINVEVRKVACSPCGSWLATNEMRDDKETHIENRLKFWKLVEIESGSKFQLSTTVHLPHKKLINDMRFAPNSKVMVTTSEDRTFKVWNCVQEDVDDGDDEVRTFWECSREGFRNNVHFPTFSAFSKDSTLLAVVFDTYVTFWDISDQRALVYKDEVVLAEVEDIGQNFGEFKAIGFGAKDETFQYFVEIKQLLVRTWNLFSLKVASKLKLDKNSITVAVVDSFSDRVAIFCSNNVLKVLRLFDLTPQITLNIAVEPNTGIFIPDQRTSRLMFLDTNQTMYTIVPEDESEQFENSSKMTVSETEKEIPGQTRLARMLIDRKDAEMASGQLLPSITDKDIRNYIGPGLRVDMLVEEMFSKVPSHVLPPINILSKTFISSLLIDDDLEVAKVELGAGSKSNVQEVEMASGGEESEEEKSDNKDQVVFLEQVGHFDTFDSKVKFDDFSWLDEMNSSLQIS